MAIATDAQIEELCEKLRGQCQHGLHDLCEEMGLDETQELCTAVDGEVFCCDVCGWYCERCEEVQDDTCDSCWVEDDDGEDEG